jgi:DNA-binding NarL/FixJ family response regulator
VTAIRLAVIDDHPLFREGVARCLKDLGFEVVGEGSDVADALRIAKLNQADVMLIDLSMPGGGLNAIQSILENHPAQKIVVLTVSERIDDVTGALNKGAWGYVLKGVGSRALAEILETVAAGERYVSPTLSARVLSDLSVRSRHVPAKCDPVADLNDREKEVLSLVASGLSNKRIALRLDLHEKTIKHHMTRILAKLHASNRTEAAIVLLDATRYERPPTPTGSIA